MWDKPSNKFDALGYLTTYALGYDEIVKDSVIPFSFEEIPRVISSMQDYLDYMLDKDTGEIDDSGILLIGINSNSFHEEHDKHHIFLEWDGDNYIPEMWKLEELGGMIVETGRGMHLILESNITMSELYSTMKEWNCCKGFTEVSNEKKHACLRICPKPNNNRLKILKNKEGLFYSVYREFLEKLDKEIWEDS